MYYVFLTLLELNCESGRKILKLLKVVILSHRGMFEFLSKKLCQIIFKIFPKVDARRADIVDQVHVRTLTTQMRYIRIQHSKIYTDVCLFCIFVTFS